VHKHENRRGAGGKTPKGSAKELEERAQGKECQPPNAGESEDGDQEHTRRR
jgi:hypothetical protein